MLAEKLRTDDDWRELGEHIYRARKGLADAWVKSSQMFDNRDPHTREVKELYESLWWSSTVGTLTTARSGPSVIQTRSSALARA